MPTEEELKKKLWDIFLIVEDIKKFPQTYSTILGGKVTNCSNTKVLKRKLNNLVSDGFICKTSIPGTRFGQVIFYALPKEYNIIVESGRMGSSVYCFFKYEKRGKFYMDVTEYWKLKEGLWENIKEPKTFFEGDVLKWI